MASIRAASRWASFNPRPREGGDTVYRDNPEKRRYVSIHAPVKGATKYDNRIQIVKPFQSTPP